MSETLYSCFDFRFASDIPLGELAPAPAGDARAIVTIALGDVPHALDGADDAMPHLQRVGDAVLLAVPQVARFLVTGGRSIVVEPLSGATERAVRLFLLGSALGVLAYQRGLLPLHANAIVVDGRVHAFAGPSGAGKSTLAAHFAGAGYPVLCDDVCAVSFDSAGRPLAWPGLPRLKLWEDAARAFGHDTGTLDRALDGYAKFHVPIRAVAEGRALPLAGFYILDRADPNGATSFERLRGAEAMRAVMENGYRPGYVARLGLQAEYFAACARVIANAAIHRLRRGWGYDVFAREARLLEAHLRQGTAT